LVERVAMIKAGLTDPTRPQGVFLFVGPTGTGKTEIAKTLAEFLFGSPERMIRLDMSEFQTPDALDRVLGESQETTSDSAALVNLIRKQPFSVVLLDEFEKAHPNVWDLFLQVFDDGRLTDRRGNTADFRHCVVIMTSNLGATLPHGATVGFSGEQAQFTSAGVERAVGRSFRREFVNRIDRVVVFRPLGMGVMRELLRKELNDVLHRRGLRTRQWAVEWDESAIEFLLQKGFTADLGARPLKRAVERYVLSPLAMTIVNHQFPEGDQFLFVRSAPDGESIDVQFVDPDAPDEASTQEAAAAELPEETEGDADGEVRLESIALDARGTPEEVRLLQSSYRELAERTDADEWHERKASALGETQAPGFWDSPARFAVLGLAEYMDRIEAGLDTAGSLLGRLTGSRDRRQFPPRMVARVAEQLYLVGTALAGLEAGEPRDAFLSVHASREAGADKATSDRLARALTQMYRNWAEKRRMRFEVLEETDGVGPDDGDDGEGVQRGYRALAAVSGFGAYTILRPEAGLHVMETPQDEKSFNRAKAVVRVVAQPDEPAGHGEGAVRRQAERALDREANAPQTIVRRYREEPSPLVRDSARGWRTGKIERVLGGDFDLLS
ncbi:MAG TPA: AAA family ATPase, partial [Pyrinomonadaceae bacterium]